MARWFGGTLRPPQIPAPSLAAQGLPDPGDFRPARCLADGEHSLPVDILYFCPAQGSAVFIEEACGCLEELQPPPKYLVLFVDVGKLGQEGEDDHESAEVCHVAC